MGTMNENEKQRQDRGDPRRSYGNTGETNEKRNQHRDAPEKPEEFPYEKGPDPDRRAPERADS